MLKPWLRLFRIVNLPTVPGDVFVGAAAAMCWCGRASATSQDYAAITLAAASSCFLYLFGLVDNDIAGAETDKGRPIPDGEISMYAARRARDLCFLLGLFSVTAICLLHSSFAELVSVSCGFMLLLLACAICTYNRTKSSAMMGVCRGLNVVLGVTAVAPPLMWPRLVARAPLQACVVAAVAVVWVAYIAAVTKYSEGEEADPERRRMVGQLLGGIVYLQISVLAALSLFFPSVTATRRLLVACAAMLVALRVLKFAFPRVSAS